jgi:hypothetical protein
MPAKGRKVGRSFVSRQGSLTPRSGSVPMDAPFHRDPMFTRIRGFSQRATCTDLGGLGRPVRVRPGSGAHTG